MIFSYKKLSYKITTSSEQKNYPINYINDGEQKTAWVAGKNKGIGEIITLEFNKKEFVENICLYAGYVKNDEVFLNNNRVKKSE